MASRSIVAGRKNKALKDMTEILTELCGQRAVERMRVKGAVARDKELSEAVRWENAVVLVRELAPRVKRRDETPLEAITAINSDTRERLEARGVKTKEDLRDMSDEALLALDGIGPGTLQRIRAQL
jgi:hypothetical protein